MHKTCFVNKSVVVGILHCRVKWEDHFTKARLQNATTSLKSPQSNIFFKLIHTRHFYNKS